MDIYFFIIPTTNPQVVAALCNVSTFRVPNTKVVEFIMSSAHYRSLCTYYNRVIQFGLGMQYVGSTHKFLELNGLDCALNLKNWPKHKYRTSY